MYIAKSSAQMWPWRIVAAWKTAIVMSRRISKRWWVVAGGSRIASMKILSSTLRLFNGNFQWAVRVFRCCVPFRERASDEPGCVGESFSEK
jgi:hypothetical protein